MKDYTKDAVSKQLEAMGCMNFEVGVLHSEKGMLNRFWDVDTILKNVSWLKKMNAANCNIYVRPDFKFPHGLVLVDDLKASAIEQMKANRYEVAVVVETSPENYQVWLKLPAESLLPEQRLAVAKLLAALYDGDKNSATDRHYGRLAGFTNRKSKYQNAEGLFPYVKLKESTGKDVRNTESLLQLARGCEALQKKKASLKSIAPQQGTPCLQAFRQEMHYWSNRLDDLSRVDFRTCLNLAKKGYSGEEIKQALSQLSPELENRKAGHVEDYVNRTVEKVIAILQLSQAEEEKAKEMKAL